VRGLFQEAIDSAPCIVFIGAWNPIKPSYISCSVECLLLSTCCMSEV